MYLFKGQHDQEFASYNLIIVSLVSAQGAVLINPSAPPAFMSLATERTSTILGDASRASMPSGVLQFRQVRLFCHWYVYSLYIYIL